MPTRYVALSWHGLNFDFTGVVFDGGDFRAAVFFSGTISFRSTASSNALGQPWISMQRSGGEDRGQAERPDGLGRRKSGYGPNQLTFRLLSSTGGAG